MSMDLDLFCFMVPVMIPSAVLLSVIILVAGCGWPMSMRQFLVEMASCPFLFREVLELVLDGCFVGLFVSAGYCFTAFAHSCPGFWGFL